MIGKEQGKENDLKNDHLKNQLSFFGNICFWNKEETSENLGSMYVIQFESCN